MPKIISVPFDFRGRQYYCLVRFKNKNDHTELYVTIMNGDLERLLHGNNKFQYQNGYLVVDIPTDGSIQAELKLQLVYVLDDYLCKHREESAELI
jgi:hypothetical protein